MWNIESWDLSQDQAKPCRPFFQQANLYPICLYTPTASHAIFYSPDVSWRLVWLRGLWLPICVALWLLAVCVVASVRSCHCGALCARALCGQGRQSGRRSGSRPYPATEEIDRSLPLLLIISCQSAKTAVESAPPLSGRGISCSNDVNYFHSRHNHN